MSERTRQRIEVGLLSLLFGAGAGWGAFQWQLSALAEQVMRIDTRVTAMYCAQIPEPQRAACR